MTNKPRQTQRAAESKGSAASLREYLAEIGAKGGRAKTEAKAAASKANGAAPVKPGSRPRGGPKKPRDQKAENASDQ